MSSSSKTALLVMPLLLCSCTGPASKPSNTNVARDVFPREFNHFSEYLFQVKKYLKGNSLIERSEAQISLNYPFERPANKHVIYRGKFLLLHGLNDSPYVWQDMAKVMTDRGFDVRAILFAGHGSHPQDMLTVSPSDWLKSAKKHYQLYQSEDATVPIYLGGFSMGAVIATSLALDNPEVAGLLLVSPAYHSRLNGWLSLSSLYSKFRPWLFGTMIGEDNPMKYNSIAINSAAAYYSITQHLKRKWAHKKLATAVLMVHSVRDSVVDVEYSRNIFKNKFINKNKQLLLYNVGDRLLARQSSASTNNKLFSGEITRPSYYPSLRILNQSHLSLINTPLNPLYGKQGTQLICNGNQYKIYRACLNTKGHWFGAQHTQSPDGIAVARVTYNPDFQSIVNAFDHTFLTANPN